MIRLAEGLSLPVDAGTQTWLIVGKRGSGKSTTAVRLAEQLYKAGVPIVAIDPVDIWWGLKAARDGKGPGLGVYVFGGRHADLPLEPTAGALIADVVLEHRISAVLSVKHFSGRERARLIGEFAQRLFQRSQEPLHVFLEEAHEVAPQQPYKGEEEMLGHVTRIWKLGRASGLGGSAITQRPASLSKNITTQAEILVVHRTLGPQDVAAIREWIRYHGEREDILAQISTLKTGEAFVWAPDFPEGKPVGLQRVKILDRETFDSSATPKAGARPREPKRLAEVDLEALQKRMAATVERAKAENPRHLRARIADLERQLRSAPAAKPPPPKEIAVLKDAQLKRLEATSERLRALGGDMLVAARAIAEAVGGIKIPPRAAPSSSPPKTAGENGVARRTIPAPRRRDSDVEEVLGAERRVLKVLAAHAPARLSRSQLGTLAGLAHRGGTFNTYLSRLRTGGYVQEDGQLLSATSEGMAAAGELPPSPTSPAEVQAMWRRSVGENAAGRLIDVLVRVYPESLARGALADLVGLTASAGTFNTYLSRLRSNALIEEQDGEVRASATLMGEI